MLGDHAPIIISIRALRVEGDVNLANVNLCHVISIHALRVEGDIQNVRKIKRAIVFLSTPSGWRATREIAYETYAL